MTEGDEPRAGDASDRGSHTGGTTDSLDGGGEESGVAGHSKGGPDSVANGCAPVAGDRRDRVTRHPTPGPGNSLQSWTDAKHPFRIVFNYVFVVAARHAPSLRLKNWLLRRIGVDVGSGVSWGLESTPDVFWPELITVEDDVIVGYDATLLCHEFLQDEYRTGEIRVGERAMIGAGAVVLPGVEIGAEAQVAANSLVAEDVPPGETWAGVPARPLESESVAGTTDDTRS